MAADPRVGVLHLISGLSLGGAERMLLWSARTHDRQRFRMGVVSLLSGGELAGAIRREGVRVEELSFRPGRVSPAGLRALRGAVKSFSPRVLAGHMFHGNLLARLAGLAMGRMAVLNAVHIDREGFLHRGADALTRFAVDGVLAFSEAAARGTAGPRWGGGPLRVVPYGIELPSLPPLSREAARARLGLPAGGWLFLAMGRMTRQKGFDLLLDAFAGAAARDPACRLLLVGRGKDEPALRARAARLGVGPAVTFHPGGEDPAPFFAAADAFVLSSRWEAGPLVVMEAQAAGLPVVATRVGAVPRLVEEGVNGLIVSPDSLRELALAMDRARAAGPAARAWGAAGRGKAVREYGFARTQREVEEFTLEVLGRKEACR